MTPVTESEKHIGVTKNRSLFRVKLASLVVIIPIVIIFALVYIAPNRAVHYGTVTSVIPTSVEPTTRTKIRYKHTQRRLPQCIIIGVRKAGTRALLKFLNLHPAVQTAAKEIHYFDRNHHLDLNWYRKRMPFSFPDQITIEKTPAYFTVKSVPELVHDMNGTIKLLLIVRDPTERVVSDWLQLCTNQLAKNQQCTSFETRVIDADTGKINKSYQGVRRSIYIHHMRNWLRWFPLSRFTLSAVKPWWRIQSQRFVGSRDFSEWNIESRRIISTSISRAVFTAFSTTATEGNVYIRAKDANTRR